MDKHLLMGVHITERVKHATLVQQTLTDYGCTIKTRIGLHEADGSFCSPNGLIMLEVIGDESKFHELADKLNDIEGVETKTMVFDHP